MSDNEVPELHYAFGPFQIDVSSRRLLRHDVVVPLTSKVFDTLVLLVKNQKAVVTKEEIVNAVWPNTFVSDDSLVQNISAIRRALGDDRSQPRYIATLARRGYSFIAPVEERTLDASLPANKADTVQLEQAASVVDTRPPLLRLAAAVLLGLVLGVGVMWITRGMSARATPGMALRFQESLPPGQILEGGLALAPDGRSLAFIARDDESGERRIWIRTLNGDKAAPIEQSSGATAPFWSPDGQFLAYSVGGSIKRIAVTGGTPQPVVGIQRGLSLGGSWGIGDHILYVDQGKIFSVSASGGTRTIIVDGNQVGPGELRWPQFLPDGRHFLFVVNSDYPSRSATFLGDLNSHTAARLMDRSDSPVVYAAPNYLVYIRDHTLWTQRFDASSGKILGDPKPIVGDLPEGVDVSANGGLVAVAEHKLGARAIWFDRAGKELETFKVPAAFTSLSISPDGQHALATSTDRGTLTLWEVDLARNTTTRLAANAGFPAWAPDGKRFAFISVGTGGAADLHVRSTMNADDAVWLKNDDIKVVTDWSRDGRFIVYSNANETSRGVWLLPTFGDHAARHIVQTPGHFNPTGRLSPDAQVIAYVSEENGTREVYLQSIPVGGSPYQVSSGGGVNPVWRGDGRELYYMAPDRHLMAVPLSGSPLAPGKPQPLFATPGSIPFAAAKDGRRFLAIARDRSGDYGSIMVLTNAAAAIQ